MTIDVKQTPSLSRWVPAAAALVLLALLLRAGFWQLDKANHKTVIRDAYQNSDLEIIAAPFQVSPMRDLYRTVSASGRFDGEKQFLIDNIVRNGRNGFFVITAMRLNSGGELLLVNRGWIPQDPARRLLPDIAVEDTPRTLRGRVGKLPSPGLKLEAEPPPADLWPSVRQYPDLKELESALGESVYKWVLLMAPEASDGYLRTWTPQGPSPERHLGYAVQWFALALTLFIIVIAAAIRARRKERE